MTEEVYSVEQVADRLNLHVRTVRGYIRSGRLRAVRIGKQYRITAGDLDALTGQTTPGVARQAEVSSIVGVDGVDRAAADRLGTLVLTSANTGHDQASPLRVQTVYDEQRHRMKIIILGDPAATAELLHLLDAVLNAGNGLLDREVHDA
ncbi:helix-turn-helix domain-containing protein [Micromonospora sp. NPDC047644]|uniref:helix-turn-helix domain-containing protein n=1 Tax=Micromonospora sp. NPDC047644 TaxID=3157203 RepID=UPI0034542362